MNTYGLYIQNNVQYLVIEENIVRNPGYTGIYLDKVMNAIVKANVIRNPSYGNSNLYDGITIYYGDKISITDNVIIDDQATNTMRYGIYAHTSTQNCVFKNNAISGYLTAAMLIENSNNIVKNNIGYITENSGTATFSGDGSAKDFEIGAHGLAVTDPEKIVVKVTPISDDAIAASPCVGYVDPADNTKIRVKFASAPASGADNVKIKWLAEVWL